MKNRKIIAMTAAAVSAALIFSGCAGTSSETTTAEQTTSVETTTETTEETTTEPEVNVAYYVMMNIPYSEFFAGEYDEGDEVDVVSSATMNKPAVEGLTAGSYHTEDNSKILGVSYPVGVAEGVTLDESLKVADEASLYGAADYSYVELTEEPEYYKVLTEDGGKYSFGASKGEVTELTYESVALTTSSVWSDYEIDFDESLSEYTVFAAILKTEEGDSYGLRVLENLWRGFEIGFTVTDTFQDPHSSELLYEPYIDIAGQTINEIIYFTTDGMKSIKVDLYVPIKFENTITIADANINDKKTSIKLEGFPEDYEPDYEITGGSDDIALEGDEIVWANALAGTYTFTVSDTSGKYAPYSQEFILSTDTPVAQAGNECVVKADGATDEEFAAYISNITAVQVGDQSISASGHRSTKLILEDGSIDKTQASVFSQVGEYTLVIQSAGYPDLTVTCNITEVAETQAAAGGNH